MSTDVTKGLMLKVTMMAVAQYLFSFFDLFR
ncbi:uncharacterized protein METZ01_LOCUS450178 [marine metagenome]|uniref:Uncharacterized protein n=1 Tax=marine metagenome TaxID=408172 RepID=A0A382ZPC6_9ZZZZ